MAKNHEKYMYYDVAVPLGNTQLLTYLEQMHANTNIPEGQLLVQFATAYVKQMTTSGFDCPLAVLNTLQAVITSMFSAVPQLAVAAPMNAAAEDRDTV